VHQRIGARLRRQAAGLLALALVGLMAVASSPAGATFAGRNGRIAFEHITRDRPPQIATVTPRGTHARVLTDFRQGAFGPAWSPNGGRIAFSGRGSVVTVRAGATASGGSAVDARAGVWMTSSPPGRPTGGGSPSAAPTGR
jgi:hypothetical protein